MDKEKMPPHSLKLPILPTVVVVAYNRPDALRLLLTSLLAARYPSDAAVNLVISIDASPSDDVLEVANDTHWPFGSKTIIRQPNQLGLRNHILFCGDLTAKYESIILFEDDLLVGPHYYQYVCAAIQKYDADDRIAGISLYNYQISEFNNFEFDPIEDGSDIYFLQIAASWGQAWTRNQWNGFRNWYKHAQHEPISVSDSLPKQLEAWKSSSWKKYYIKYLVNTGRYFVFPRAGQSTNMARPGTHTKREVAVYQSPLDFGPREWRFRSLDDSFSRYDVYYELSSEAFAMLCPTYSSTPIVIDLFGEKPSEASPEELRLSSRPCKLPLTTFGSLLNPPVANVIFASPGNLFAIAATSDFKPMTQWRRLKLAKLVNPAAWRSKWIFQLLKPVQVWLVLRLAR